jgi:hypothetical protein
MPLSSCFSVTFLPFPAAFRPNFWSLFGIFATSFRSFCAPFRSLCCRFSAFRFPLAALFQSNKCNCIDCFEKSLLKFPLRITLFLPYLLTKNTWLDQNLSLSSTRKFTFFTHTQTLCTVRTFLHPLSPVSSTLFCNSA